MKLTPRFSVASKDGIFKANADCQKYDIRGPLCYKADYLAKDVELPQVEHGENLWVLLLFVLKVNFYQHDSYFKSLNLISFKIQEVNNMKRMPGLLAKYGLIKNKV